MSNVSKSILKLRAKLGVSQQELAKILNVTFATINRWENGIKEPSKLHMQQLEDIFKENSIKSE